MQVGEKSAQGSGTDGERQTPGKLRLPRGKDKHVSCSAKNNRACLQTMKTTY